jgi:hypothetical protein
VSVPRRAYDLLRGYIGREYERIQGADRDHASRELSEALQNPIKPGTTPQQPDNIQPPLDRRERACLILGISTDSDFTTIRTAYQRLNRRSDPANFPPSSPEAAQAGQIQRRVQEAYRVLAEQADATEVRFKSLEIE